MTLTKLRGLSSPPLNLAGSRGTTLIETVLALGVATVVIAGIYMAWSRFGDAMARREAVADGQRQATLATDRITKYWNSRARPPRTQLDMFPKFSAAWPGFATPSSSQVLIYLSSDASQVVRVTTRCVQIKVPALAALDFSKASMCLKCGRGTAPQVTIEAPGQTSVVFPAPVKGIKQVAAGMSVCYMPWAFPNPLSLVVQHSTLDPSGKQVSVASKAVDLSLDNFAGVEINQ